MDIPSVKPGQQLYIHPYINANANANANPPLLPRTQVLDGYYPSSKLGYTDISVYVY